MNSITGNKKVEILCDFSDESSRQVFSGNKNIGWDGSCTNRAPSLQERRPCGCGHHREYDEKAFVGCLYQGTLDN